MDITFVTTAKTDNEAYELLSSFGVPFRKKEINKLNKENYGKKVFISPGRQKEKNGAKFAKLRKELKEKGGMESFTGLPKNANPIRCIMLHNDRQARSYYRKFGVSV